MIRKVSLFPELARPLGLTPATLDGLGAFNVIVGPNGSGKSRLLSAVRALFELAPRREEMRVSLSHKLAAAGDSAQRDRLSRSIQLIDAIAWPDAILVDGEHGPRPPSLQDRYIDLTYESEVSSGAVAVAFPDLAKPDRATSFAAAYRSAPAFLRNTAKNLFYGRHPDSARRPDVALALREAERFNEIAASLLGKVVSPDVDFAGGLEIAAALGDRRFQLAELSSGEGVLLTWSILLHRQASSLQGAVVVIDEPELHLHPRHQERILSTLRAALGDHGQLWVVTHSAAIAERADVTNLFLVAKGETRPWPLRPSPAEERELGLVVEKPPITLRSLRPSKLPKGISDFYTIRTSPFVYVDKTKFIEDVLCSPDAVLLFPRPRRFGKSLNLSTLRSFVEKDERSPLSPERVALFEDLYIWKIPEARRHFGRYPIIHLTFKEAKADSFSALFAEVRLTITELYEYHRRDLLDGGSLSASERALYEKILDRKGDPEEYSHALKTLSRHLARHHGERVIILVDEYDTPLHDAYVHGYLDEATRFFGKFFSAGLKDNPHLFKGVLTGVLRIARESLFSELNNLSVYSILRPEFATHFGFTEGEVEDQCRRLGSPELMADLRKWYNGYLFGDQVLFNPWSVICCLNSEKKKLLPYWANTGSNDLLRKQLFEMGRGFSGDLAALLRGESIHKPVDENLVLRSLDTTPDAVWSLLLFAGYLKPTQPTDGADLRNVSLTIPNLEVRRDLEDLVKDYFSKLVGGENNARSMLAAMLRGDEGELQSYLNRILNYNASPYDADSRTPERFYHGVMLGIAVFLEPDYEVKSNHIGGRGRYDLMVIPRVKGQPGVCLEFKVSEGNEEKALDLALRQICEKDYTIELERRGAQPIYRMAVVFKGQRAWVRRG